MKKFFLIMIMLIQGAACFSQTKYMNSKSETQMMSHRVMEYIKTADIREAFNIMRPYWDISDQKFDSAIIKTEGDLKPFAHKLGDPIGFKKIKEEKISNIFVRETYFVLYKEYAIRYKFTFYKNNEGWIMFNFLWDDKYYEEFE